MKIRDLDDTEGHLQRWSDLVHRLVGGISSINN
jgi:hypothetical protein